MPPIEPGTITAVLKAFLETLSKPFTLILNPIGERIGHALQRKPKIHIYARPGSMVWCYAGAGDNSMMQAHFAADLTNDGKDAVLILDGYIKGTKPKYPFIPRIEVPPGATVLAHAINLMVTPVVGKRGKDYTGKVILIDQLNRKHRSDKITFTWTGPTERPA